MKSARADKPANDRPNSQIQHYLFGQNITLGQLIGQNRGHHKTQRDPKTPHLERERAEDNGVILKIRNHFCFKYSNTSSGRLMVFK